MVMITRADLPLKIFQLALPPAAWIASRSGCMTRSMKPFRIAGMSPHQSGNTNTT